VPFKIVEQPIQLHVVAVQIESGVERIEQLGTLSGRDLLRGRGSNLLETFIDRRLYSGPRPRLHSRHLALAPLPGAETVSGGLEVSLAVRTSIDDAYPGVCGCQTDEQGSRDRRRDRESLRISTDSGFGAASLTRRGGPERGRRGRQLLSHDRCGIACDAGERTRPGVPDLPSA
jgi:hypothetical protein